MSNISPFLSNLFKPSTKNDHFPEFGGQTVTAGNGTDSIFLKLTENETLLVWVYYFLLEQNFV